MRFVKKARSVRVVLTLWYTALLLSALVIFCGSVYFYLDHLLGQTLEQELAAEVEWIDRLLALAVKKTGAEISFQGIPLEVQERIAEHTERNPRNYFITITAPDGNVLYGSENLGDEYFAQGDTELGTMVFSSADYVKGGAMRVATLRQEFFTIHVAFPERIIQVVLGHTLSIFGLLAPVVLVLSVVGGWVLAGMLTRPVRQITQRAARITAHNLTERVPRRNVDDELSRLIDTINFMITRLESSFTQMKEFSLNVAHELKTPLTILRGESELALAKPLSPDDSQRLVTMYLEETVRMSHIVDDLLTLAKGEAGQIAMQRKPLYVDELIRELHDDALILSTNKNLSVELKENQRVCVLGDGMRLRQLFRSLVCNAVQYIDPSGTISISCRRVDNDVLVTINDNGIGIPPESLDKIFERFYRVDEARTRVKGGSGLGLSLAKWIAEAHNGKIEVQSTLGEGSSFTVRLPLFSSPASS